MKIAITGEMGSGKTYLANLISKKYNLKIYSFAKKVKEIALELFQMKNKDRKLLQDIADKLKEIDKDIWAKYILRQVKNKNNIIIDDLRFKNENQLLRENGFLIIRIFVKKSVQEDRIKNLYKNNYKSHLENRIHNSEKDINILKVDFEVESNKNTESTIFEYLDNYLKTN